MDEMMQTAFFDELGKIAANIAAPPPVPSPAKPAPISSGTKPKSSLKSTEKSTDYSVVNTQIPEAAYGSATGSKSVPPPPVRT